MNETYIALLIGGDRACARRVRRALTNAEAHWGRFTLDVVDRLSEGIARLSKGDIAAVLLDLSLPENRGLSAVPALREHAPDVPVIALAARAGGARGVKAVHAGARDYLVKGTLTGPLLVRSLRYAIDRAGWERSLRQATLVDEISGLYNRRGFLKLADQQLKLSRRMGQRALVMVAAIRNLQEVNDRFGHAAGVVAITDTTALLRQTFRASDVIGRLGGDEFAVLAVGVGEDGLRVIQRRLAKLLAAYNHAPDRRFYLSLNLGLAAVEPTDGSSLDHLLAEAGRDLQERQRPARPHAEITL